MIPFSPEGSAAMNDKEFIEAILKSDEETIITVCQLLEVNPQLVEFPDLPLNNSHIVC